MKVFINPGHCVSFDSGACGFGITEAETALDIGNRVKKYLQKVGYDVYLFQFDGLGEIVEECDDWGADLCVSIHCNASVDGSARGTETYFYDSAEGERLARCIQNLIIEKCGTFDRGIKEKGFFILRNIVCPAVLVETAFIDNVHDNALLVDCADNFAKSISVGITDFVSGRFKHSCD